MVTWEPKHLIQYAKAKNLPLPKATPAPKTFPRKTIARQGYSRKVVGAFFATEGIVPVFECRFHADRRWKFDLAWPWAKLALECQGGIWIRGRHVRGAALKREWEKLNTAAALGWRILYCEPKDLCTRETLRLVQVALDGYP